MDIKFINKKNKEKNSITSIVIDGVEYPLTEKELQSTLKSFFDTRDDLFYASEFELGRVKEDYDDLKEEYENDISNYETEISDLRDDVAALEEELQLMNDQSID